MPKREFNVADIIDNGKLSRFQIWVIALCAIIAISDGFDTQAIAFVAPVIAKEWGLSVPAFGSVFAAGLFGLMIGSMLFGAIADRFGRKYPMIISMSIIVVFCFLTAHAETINELLLMRLLTGIGIGGILPNILSLSAEYSPKRMRNTLLTIMFCGFPLGAVLGGLISAKMIPVYGWESVFYLGGIISLVLIPVMFLGLPESLRFIVLKDKSTRVAEILRKINPSGNYSTEDAFLLSEEKLSGTPVKYLFKNGLAKITILLWFIFFMNLLTVYFMTNWLPSILQNVGFPLEKAIIATVVFNAGSITGGLIIGRLIDKYGAVKVLITSYVSGGIVMGLIGFLASSYLVLFSMIFITALLIVGGLLGIQALATAVYPTMVRSTGLGWCLGIGRVGSIIGPVIGGMMLSMNMSLENIFLFSTIPAFIAALAILFLKRAQSEISINR
jgi:MFS transporter, AAHS family, 4-hydroxybenzoate transporter